MKQYTTPAQTAKLIELGFEKPKSIGGYEPTFVVEYEGVEVSNIVIGENKQEPIYAYSIGELLEVLGYDLYSIVYRGLSWEVNGENTSEIGEELIDALYKMVIKLKEEGVI